VRAFFARESALLWWVWGARLDGRTNADRSDDVDYAWEGDPTADPNRHDQMLNALEKKKLAWWVDLGGPMGLSNRPGAPAGCCTNDYDDPAILPILSVDRKPTQTVLRIGGYGLKDAIDTGGFTVSIDEGITGFPAGDDLSSLGAWVPEDEVLEITLPEPITVGPHSLTSEAADTAGNSRGFSAQVEVQAAGGGPSKRPFGGMEGPGPVRSIGGHMRHHDEREEVR
jgi:hypothetical protein